MFNTSGCHGDEAGRVDLEYWLDMNTSWVLSVIMMLG